MHASLVQAPDSHGAIRASWNCSNVLPLMADSEPSAVDPVDPNPRANQTLRLKNLSFEEEPSAPET